MAEKVPVVMNHRVTDQLRAGTLRVSLSLLLGLTSAGCDRPRESWEQAFSQQDSTGVQITETKEEQAYSRLAWVVDREPSLQIGAVEGDPWFLFSRVQGVARLPDGRIVVADGGSREIRVFKQDGTLATIFGGPGEGPGEFVTDPRLLPSTSLDSLLVFDRMLQRVTAFTPEGKILGTEQLSDYPSTPVDLPRGPSALRTFSSLIGEFGNRLAFTRSTSLMGYVDETGPRPRDPLEFGVIDTGAHEMLSIGVIPGEWGFLTPADRDSGLRAHFPMPLVVPPTFAVGKDLLYTNSDGGNSILGYDTSGSLKRIVRIRGDGRAVTPADVEAFVDEEVRTFRNEELKALLRTLYRELPLPAIMPVIRSINVDDSGWIWAQRYKLGNHDTDEWIVFDNDGRARGVAQFPASLRVWQIGPDFVLGVAQDSMGVQYVRQYHLDRTN